MSYIDLLDHSDYEILNEYPFTIRRKDNHYEVSESLRGGYPRVNLNGKSYNKHRLIALQFIHNDDPENKIQVDHRNKIRTDYHIENLYWVTPSDNRFNTTGRLDVIYEYFDEIPDESIVIDSYETNNGMRYFNVGRYYYYYDEENDKDIFYGKVKDDLYRRLHINIKKNGSEMIRCVDIDNKYVSVYITKFKHQYNLL